MSSYPGGLGQQPHFDVRNLKHLIADSVADPEAHSVAIAASRGAGSEGVLVGKAYEYHYDTAWWGDQGQTTKCTEYAGNHGLADGPVTNKPVLPEGTLYEEIVAIDRSEGRYYSDGATSLAMAKALQRRGKIGAYLWGYTLAEFVAAIKESPVLLGIDWYEGMDWPETKTGIVRATGRIRGGHEILANGANFASGLVRLKNSWGRSWGRGGHCYLPFEDLEALIADGGDVCLFRELKVAA